MKRDVSTLTEWEIADFIQRSIQEEQRKASRKQEVDRLIGEDHVKVRRSEVDQTLNNMFQGFLWLGAEGQSKNPLDFDTNDHAHAADVCENKVLGLERRRDWHRHILDILNTAKAKTARDLSTAQKQQVCVLSTMLLATEGRGRVPATDIEEEGSGGAEGKVA
jgi:hypothetical protein